MRRTDVFKSIFQDVTPTIEARKILKSKGWEEFEPDLWWNPKENVRPLDRNVINLYYKVKVGKSGQEEVEFKNIHQALEFIERSN